MLDRILDIRALHNSPEKADELTGIGDDGDLNEKLAAWESFYNLNRPHGAHGAKPPYEALRCMLG